MPVMFNNGVILFKTGSIAMSSECCCSTVECALCESTIPEQIDATLPTLTGGGDCSSPCEGSGGTYRLDYLSTVDTETGIKCTWRLDIGGGDCDVDYIEFYMTGSPSGAGTIDMQLLVSRVDGEVIHVFQNSGEDNPIDCDFDDYAISTAVTGQCVAGGSATLNSVAA